MIRLRASLRAKVLLAFALVLLPVAVMLWVDFRAGIERQEESILRSHELTAQAIALQVDEAFDALISFAWAVANDPTVRSGAVPDVDRQLRTLLGRAPQVALIAVHDAHGANRGWAGPEAAARASASRPNIFNQPDFQQVMALNLPQISDVLPPDRLGLSGLVATVPIRDQEDRPEGVVVVGALADQLARRYEHARLLPEQAIFLADRTGRLAFHTSLRPLPYEKSGVLATAEPLRSALAGIANTQRHFPSILGTERLAAFVPTHKYRWAVGVTVPRALALAPLQQGFQRELVAFGGILLVSVALALVLARLLVEPVHRLEAAATALGQGDLTRRVNIDTGDEVGRLGAAFDNMAAQLTTLYDEQRQSLRLREEFMQAAAHELKTPISTIRSSVHLLLAEQGARDPQERRTLEIIRRQSRRMTLLVEDLLMVTRLGSAAPQLNRTRVDVDRLGDESVRRAAELSEKHAISWKAEGQLAVDTDAELLGAVLVRLLENAVGASPGGGPIDLAARREGGEVVVSVADRGVGIPLERQAHVFEPFFETVPSGRPGYTGVVSLRLHLCKRIMDALGGRLWFVSTPFEGSTFSFSLPLAESNRA
jgi:signal transduction histidine kinase